MAFADVADHTDYSLAELIAGDLQAHDRYQGKSSKRSTLTRTLFLSINPYFGPVLLIRLAWWFDKRGRLGTLVALVISRINYVMAGVEVARQTPIGPGLYMPHTRGTVIGAASIGSDVVIYHGVTLGARMIDVGFNADTRPSVGNDVVIGAGAKIVGHLHVGDGARIGPNAVVIHDVQPNAVMVAPLAVTLVREAERSAKARADGISAQSAK